MFVGPEETAEEVLICVSHRSVGSHHLLWILSGRINKYIAEDCSLESSGTIDGSCRRICTFTCTAMRTPLTHARFEVRCLHPQNSFWQYRTIEGQIH